MSDRSLLLHQIMLRLPPRQSQSPNGWISFNCPHCSAMGESRNDTRQRGGINVQDTSFSIHCFNCQFKTHYHVGMKIPFKLKWYMKSLGFTKDEIKTLNFRIWQLNQTLTDEELAQQEQYKKQTFSFSEKELPDGAVSVKTLPDNHPTHEYIMSRGFDVDDYNWMWTPNKDIGEHKRIILPFIWENKCVGYTSRIMDKKTKLRKYLTHQDPNFVFNIPNQLNDAKFVIVTEGPFTALAVGGVAVLGNNINDTQAEFIDSLDREVIVAPDNDEASENIIDCAINFGWSVSKPNFGNFGDLNDVMLRYGRLFTIKQLWDNKVSSALKIELLKKGLYA